MLKPAFLLGCFLLSIDLSLAQTPASYTDKVAGYPDIWQKDPRGNFPGGGGELCCPASVSSSLIYFANNGYPNLIPDPGSSDFETQAALIRLLSSKKYFDTDLSIGTPPSRMISGTQRYITDCGYTVERVEYAGWRPLGRSQKDLVVAPLVDLDWLKAGIADPNGMVWLNVGWYTKGDEPGTWVRNGGHWVTLVGYEAGKNLLIHNSLINRTEPVEDNSAYHVALLPLPTDSTFTTTDDDSTEHSTEGMYQVKGTALPSRNSVAFLDAAILVVIGK